MYNQKRARIWEIDLARALGIILMMLFHFVFDLREFYNYDIDYNKGIYFVANYGAKFLFITTAGISSTLSRNNVKRGLRLLGIAMILTVVTYMADSTMYINFGILHFLGISTLIYYFIKNLRVAYLTSIAVACYFIGIFFEGITVASPYLFPLGLRAPGFASLDYFPIFPWFALYIVGVIIGKTLYSQRKSIFSFRPKLNFLFSMSDHSLLIYLLHQPVFLAILYLAHKG